jgi:hypothetical protein
MCPRYYCHKHLVLILTWMRPGFITLVVDIHVQ